MPENCKLLRPAIGYGLEKLNLNPKCKWWNVLVPFAKTFESSVWLLPKPSVWGDQVLVETKKKYTANNYRELFKRIGYKNSYSMFEVVKKIDSQSYPDVPTYCFYGKEKKTPTLLHYKLGKGDILKNYLKKMLSNIKNQR